MYNQFHGLLFRPTDTPYMIKCMESPTNGHDETALDRLGKSKTILSGTLCRPRKRFFHQGKLHIYHLFKYGECALILKGRTRWVRRIMVVVVWLLLAKMAASRPAPCSWPRAQNSKNIFNYIVQNNLACFNATVQRYFLSPAFLIIPTYLGR